MKLQRPLARRGGFASKVVRSSRVEVLSLLPTLRAAKGEGPRGPNVTLLKVGGRKSEAKAARINRVCSCRLPILVSCLPTYSWLSPHLWDRKALALDRLDPSPAEPSIIGGFPALVVWSCLRPCGQIYTQFHP